MMDGIPQEDITHNLRSSNINYTLGEEPDENNGGERQKEEITQDARRCVSYYTVLVHIASTPALDIQR